MCREEEPIFVPARRVLGRHNVQQASDWHFDRIDDEELSLVPNGFEVIARHDQREIHLQIVEDRCGECLPRHDVFC